MTSAGELMVDYGAMAAGSGAMRGATSKLRAEADTLASAATAISATWDAGSYQAFRDRHKQINDICDHIDMQIASHAGAIDEQSAQCSATDSTCAAGF